MKDLRILEWHVTTKESQLLNQPPETTWIVLARNKILDIGFSDFLISLGSALGVTMGFHFRFFF
jgi:hypothetical protein